MNESKIDDVNKSFDKIENDVLDEFNQNKISKKEMVNIMQWCELMKINLIDKINSDQLEIQT